MGLITEAVLRAQLKKNPNFQLTLHEGDILTPSAKQLIRDKGITCLSPNSKTPENKVKENHYKPFETLEGAFKPKFVSEYDGGLYEHKPEYMTHLRGNRLVFKDDQRIVFRGQVDRVQGLILEIQWQLKETPYKALLKDIDELLTCFRKLLRAEVLEEAFEIETLFGLTDSELRAHSHDPHKHYGIQHFLPDVAMGIEVVLLNKLRTEIRALELCAMKTFREGAEVKRKDIIQVLNRLSSATYILMCRIRGKYYGS